MSYLTDWWGDSPEGNLNLEGARYVGHEKLVPVDRGYPAQSFTCVGLPTPHPWSAALGAVERIQKRLNLPKLRHRVYQLMGVL